MFDGCSVSTNCLNRRVLFRYLFRGITFCKKPEFERSSSLLTVLRPPEYCLLVLAFDIQIHDNEFHVFDRGVHVGNATIFDGDVEFVQEFMFLRASRLGFREGTEEYQQYARLATADLFVIGLALMFPASMFGANLPAPYDRLVNMSEFFFGNDDDKQKAFFGVPPYPMNPLQSVEPPMMRVPNALFGTMLSGDWQRFASYHVWTWFPFGRIGVDLAKTIDAPSMVLENMVGLPVHQM